MKKTAFLLTILLALNTTACAFSGSQAKPLVSLPKTQKITEYGEIHALSTEIYEDESLNSALDGFAESTAAVLQTPGNVNYSPLSLYFALAVAKTGGADDPGLDELLGYDSAGEFTDRFAKLWQLLCRTGEYTECKVANSVWSDAGIKPDFAKTAAESFYAECFDSLSADKMSAWIAQNTGGTLKPEIKLVENQLISILNTVYFKAEWTDRFNSSNNETGTFHAPTGDVAATFMQDSEIKGFTRGDNYTTASRGFKDDGGMTIVLPDEGTDIRELLESEGLEKLLHGGEQKSGYVNWYFPKFGFEFDFSAKELFCDLGAGGLFAENTGMAKNITDSEPMSISDIVQGTYIEVDEKGVTASSYTNIIYCGSPAPVDTADMRMDRPFLYAIFYRGILLFVGIVDDPTVK